MERSLFSYIWKNNRRDHLVVLLITLASLPFYLLSLDLPKRIINEAIIGSAFEDGNLTADFWPNAARMPKFLGGHVMFPLPSWLLERASYLYALAGLFLALAMVNVAFRHVIDAKKGALGERLTRRLRFEVFSRYLRFPPAARRGLKGSDAQSVIVDEVSYLSPFFVDGSPVELILRVATAIFFMLTQNVALGLMAAGMVASQAAIVPWLQREQVRLTIERGERQRKLGQRVASAVDNLGVVQGHGASGFEAAWVGALLGRAFATRLQLFRRRLAMTTINLALVEATPFLFYVFGGYLALPDQLGGAGAIDVGQLVAIIAAYRDLPEPVRELVVWDQRRLEMRVRYDHIRRAVSPEALLAEQPAADPPAPPPARALDLQSVRIVDPWGATLVESVTLSLALPAHVALAGAVADGQRALAQALGQRRVADGGRITLDGVDLATLPAGRRIAYLDGEPALFDGTIRDNILFGIRRRTPPGAVQVPAAEMREALLSGNPAVSADDDWADYAAAGAQGRDGLDARIVEVLQVVGFEEETYRAGLANTIDPGEYPELAGRIVEARARIHAMLGEEGASGLIEPFDPARYNSNSTVGENLLFGVARDATFEAARLPGNPFVAEVLEAEGLTQGLMAVGLGIVATMGEMFGGLPPGHMMFDRFSFIAAEDLPSFEAMLRGGEAGLAEDERARVLGLALAYCEQRHRLGLLDEAAEAAILRARGRFMASLPAALAGSIAFYNPGQFCAGAPIGDNLLFGRIAHERAAAPDRVTEAIREVLGDMGLDRDVYSIGLDSEVVDGGRMFAPSQRVAIDLARCLIKRPEVLVIDGALAIFGRSEAEAILARVRAFQAGRSVVHVVADAGAAAGFDLLIALRNGRLAGPVAAPAEKAAGTAGEDGLTSAG